MSTPRNDPDELTARVTDDHGNIYFQDKDGVFRRLIGLGDDYVEHLMGMGRHKHGSWVCTSAALTVFFNESEKTQFPIGRVGWYPRGLALAFSFDSNQGTVIVVNELAQVVCFLINDSGIARRAISDSVLFFSGWSSNDELFLAGTKRRDLNSEYEAVRWGAGLVVKLEGDRWVDATDSIWKKKWALQTVERKRHGWKHHDAEEFIAAEEFCGDIFVVAVVLDLKTRPPIDDNPHLELPEKMLFESTAVINVSANDGSPALLVSGNIDCEILAWDRPRPIGLSFVTLFKYWNGLHIVFCEANRNYYDNVSKAFYNRKQPIIRIKVFHLAAIGAEFTSSIGVIHGIDLHWIIDSINMNFVDGSFLGTVRRAGPGSDKTHVIVSDDGLNWNVAPTVS